MGMERDIKLYGHAKGKPNQQSQILWHKIACRKDISIYKNVKIFKSIKETIWLLDGGDHFGIFPVVGTDGRMEF